MSRQPIFPPIAYSEGDDNGTEDPDVDFIKRYTSDVAGLLRRLDPGPVMAAISALHGAWKAGKVVLFCGNGGSGASCSHIVNDFQKGCGLKAICLNDSMPLVSAIANDEEWAEIFCQQVVRWAETGSVVICVSGSGNSLNILRAANATKEIDGADLVTLTGFDGGRLKMIAELSRGVAIHVPTDSMQQAEDVHMVILHILYLGLKRRIEAEGKGHE